MNMSQYPQSHIAHFCPICGTEIPLKNPSSKIVVCGICESLFFIKQDNLEHHGKITRLPIDVSAFQIGSKGTIEHRNFLVLGRMKIAGSYGFWNEWYVLEDNGNQAWIIEIKGLYRYLYQGELPDLSLDPKVKSISKNEQKDNDAIYSMTTLKIGDKIVSENETYLLTEIREFTIQGIEGELPFIIKDGIEGTAMEFESENPKNQADCAYAKITELETQFFKGRNVEVESLQVVSPGEAESW